MTTDTPGLARSAQSLMPLGLPLRTRITVTDVVGALLCGKRLAQSTGTRAPRSARMSMSLAWFMVMTSAARPAMTLPACLLEPPCDWLMFTVSPVVCFQCLAKATL